MSRSNPEVSLYLAEWPGAMLCNGLHVFMCCTCQETDVNTVSLDSGGLPEVCKNISTTVQMSTTARHDHLIPHVHIHPHTHRSSNERNEDKTGYLKRCSTPTSSASSAPISLGTWSNVLVVGEPSWNITFTVTQWVSRCITMSCQPHRSHSGRWSIPQDSVTHVMCRLRTHAQTEKWYRDEWHGQIPEVYPGTDNHKIQVRQHEQHIWHCSLSATGMRQLPVAKHSHKAWAKCSMGVLTSCTSSTAM